MSVSVLLGAALGAVHVQVEGETTEDNVYLPALIDCTEAVIAGQLTRFPFPVPVVPVGCRYHHDEAILYQMALNYTETTAKVAAVAGASLVAVTLTGLHLGEYVNHVLTFCDGMSDEFDAAMLRIGHVMGWVDEAAALRHIGKEQTPPEVIAQALYCILRYDDDFTACIRCARQVRGRRDWVGMIAGGVMGARLGDPSQLPADWYQSLTAHDQLTALGKQLAEL